VNHVDFFRKYVTFTLVFLLNLVLENHIIISDSKMKIKMKKYVMMLGVLACVACNDSKKAEETAKRESEVRQQTIDSIEAENKKREEIRSSSNRSGSSNTSSSNSNNSESNDNTNTEPAKRKGMSNTTKGALIGTGAGVVGGAATGAAVSKDKGKGAIIGGAIGGAVGSGVGYGIGADKDKKEKDRRDSINNAK
jgi:hypothetical protein